MKMTQRTKTLTILPTIFSERRGTAMRVEEPVTGNTTGWKVLVEGSWRKVYSNGDKPYYIRIHGARIEVSILG